MVLCVPLTNKIQEDFLSQVKSRKRHKTALPGKRFHLYNRLPSIQAFKCKCPTRDCFQGVIDADRRDHKPMHHSFNETQLAVAAHVDVNRDARMALLWRIQKAILPKVCGRTM